MGSGSMRDTLFGKVMFWHIRVVDNRAFLLGLDGLYRRAMKRHEAGELLRCARAVSGELGLSASQGPVEGYYAESPDLTEYFQLMRTLQSARAVLRTRVARSPAYQRLEKVASAPIFGRPIDLDCLLPRGCDPLSQALSDSRPQDWRIDFLVKNANRVAVEADDYSLVGLAALAQDPVILTATRESAVLYAWPVVGAALRQPKYVWTVDRELARQSRRFVDSFNSLFSDDLPSPEPDNAGVYWNAGKDNDVMGRCVRLGMDDTHAPVRHYHWAIAWGKRQRWKVEEFWAEDLWTTTRFRERLGRRPVRH